MSWNIKTPGDYINGPLTVAGSATITGALTVDASTLVVDSINNRVIVGHTSGSAAFQVTNAGAAGLEIQPTGVNSAPVILSYNRSGSAYTQLTLDGSTIVHSLSGTTAMTLNATGLAIGGTALGKLTIKNPNVSGEQNILKIQNATSAGDLGGITFNQTDDALKLSNITASGYISFGVGGSSTERLRIDASGNLLVGATSGTFHRVLKNAATGAPIMDWVNYGSNGAVAVCTVDRQPYSAANAANCALRVGDCTGGARSINASGSINANGADYAEYMTKSGDFTIEKGDVAGIDSNGMLTNVFADAISFVVKSTDPSYVGNDNWGTGIEGAEFEAARELVDRIAFAGQVPVNVIGATAGDYIVPVADGTSIKGIAVSKPTFEQYQIAVGKVIAIEADGRARIIVKVA